MEANYIQDLFLDEFKTEGKSRGYQLAIRGDKRAKPDKFTRIENLSPLFERGVVLFSEKQKDSDDIKRCIEQFLAFEQGAKAHDDAPDAVEGAVWLLNRKDKVSEFSPVFGTVERDNAY
jgi:predicted phage terminase large subunit-like protein